MSKSMVHPMTIYYNGQPLAQIYVSRPYQSDQIRVKPEQLPSIPSSTGTSSNGTSGWKILVGLLLILAIAAAIVVPIVVLTLQPTSDSSTSTQTMETTTSTSTTTTTSQTTTTTSATTTTTSATTTTTTTDVSIVYSQSFTSGGTPLSQCTAWTSFQALLVNRTYSSLTLSGSNDPSGITLTNGTAVASIAYALHTNTTFGPITSNGYSWMFGICGSGFEITTTNSICVCNGGYTVRPCIGNSNWGGMNGTSCGGNTQTLIVTFQ